MENSDLRVDYGDLDFRPFSHGSVSQFEQFILSFERLLLHRKNLFEQIENCDLRCGHSDDHVVPDGRYLQDAGGIL